MLRMEVELNLYSCATQRIVSSQPCVMFLCDLRYELTFSALFGLPISPSVGVPDPQGHIVLCGR